MTPRDLVSASLEAVTDRLFAFLKLELELTPDRWRAIARIVVACAIATTLIMTLRIPEGVWLILTIFIVSMPGTGASVVRCLQRLLSIAVGCVISIGIVIAFPQQPWVQVPAIAVVIGLGIYLSRTSASPSIPLLGALTMILSIPGVVDSASPESITKALWRLVEIGAGNIIGTLCQAFLWPERPEKQLVESLASSLRRSKQRMHQALLPASEVVTDSGRLAENEEQIMNSLALWTNWLDNAVLSDRGVREHHDGLMSLIGATNQAAVASEQIARIAARMATREVSLEIPTAVSGQIEALEARCSRYADAIDAGQWPAELDALSALANELSEASIGASASSPEASSLEVPANARAAIVSSAVSIAQALDSMYDDVDFLRPVSRRKGLRTRSPEFVRERSTFSTAAFTKINRVDLASSAKGALAGILAYIYLAAIDWPGGITAVVTAVLICLDNYGAMILKSVLRVAGAFLGGLGSLLIILYVIPQITTLTPFLVVTSLIFGIGAWVQTGTARISYAGLQIGYAASLCLVSTHYPSVDLMPFQDRMLGIFTGLAFVVLVYGVFGEIRARVWAVDNCVESLRLLARAAGLGFRAITPSREETPLLGFRYELFRRLSFGYRLLTESGYEDWLARDQERAAQEREGLRRLLDRIRAVHRVTLSLVWNRLDFQRRSASDFRGRAEVEAVGKAVPETFLAFAERIENINEPDRSAAMALEQYSAKLRAAERSLADDLVSEDSPEAEREVRRLLHSQVSFYRQLEILLGALSEDARDLTITSDRFSIFSRLRGPDRRREAPHIRPV